MGNVVGGNVYTSLSEFTQMRVAVEKEKKEQKKKTEPPLHWICGAFCLSHSFVSDKATRRESAH